MEKSSSSSGNLYKKVMIGGKLDDKPVTQTDFDMTIKYIKKCFPKANSLQKNVEQTLKRTFMLEDSEPKRKFLAKNKVRRMKPGSTRKLRMRKERPVPKVLKYEQFVELNNLWKSYIADLLQDEERPEEIQQRLNRIDLHGAYIKVAESNCKDYIGLEGIVVKETRNVFIIVTSTGATKTVPKSEGLFDVPLIKPKGTMKICGNSYLTRPAERASKKIKSFMEFVGAKVYKSRLRYTYPK